VIKPDPTTTKPKGKRRGPKPNPDGSKRIHIRVSRATYRILEAEQARTGRSLSAVVEAMLSTGRGPA
jgi:hypothetical protein